MLVLVKTPLRWSPDGISVVTAEVDATLDLPDSLARGLLASGQVVLVPENKSMPAGGRDRRRKNALRTRS